MVHRDGASFKSVSSDDLRREVEEVFHEHVQAGLAVWRVNERGDTELYLNTGEAFVLHETGLTRLR
jgi:hypothetical protein